MLRFRVITYAIAAAVLAAPARVLAATPSEKDTPLNLGSDDKTADAASHSASGGGSILRTLIGLAIVAGIIFGLHWILKQAKASKEGKASGLGLAPVATLPIGGGRSVQLLRTGRELVLVGVGEHGVTPIRHYSEDEARELGLLPDPADEATPADGDERRPGWQGMVDLLRERTVLR
ncbi:MAG TPA: flagellar biosynthetic protein FliO [Thermoleophilaceae bacterium]